MAEYFLVTFYPKNVKGAYFRGGVGYKGGTMWVFSDFVPPSIAECPEMQIEEVDEEYALDLINKGVIYNDYLTDESPEGSVSGRYSHLEIEEEHSSHTNIDNDKLKDLESSIARLSEIIDKKISGGSLDYKEQAMIDNFDGEIDLDEVRAQIYQPDESLLSNNSKFGEVLEQETSTIDNAAALLKQTKGSNTQSPIKPTKKIEVDEPKPESEPEIIADVEEPDTFVSVKEPISEEIITSKEVVSQSNKKKARLQRISQMLQELKISQDSPNN